MIIAESYFDLDSVVPPVAGKSIATDTGSLYLAGIDGTRYLLSDRLLLIQIFLKASKDISDLIRLPQVCNSIRNRISTSEVA
jgi:hypothetical protein